MSDPLIAARAAAKGDQKALIQDMRVRALYWPYFFCKVILGNPDMTAEFHGEEIERFIERLLAGHRRQWIEWARGHLKSTTFTQGISIWFVCPPNEEDKKYAVEVLGIEPYLWDRRMTLHNQNLAQLLAFENDSNASRKIEEVKYHFEQNQIFRACFPEIAYQGHEQPWNNSAIKIRRTGMGAQVGEATFQSIGVNGALQSQHYDIVWCDDLVGKAATESEVIMATTKRWFGLLEGALRGRALGSRSCVFGISNRWGYHDLNSAVREGGMFLFHTRSIIETNPATGKEEFVFKTKFNDEVWAEIMANPQMSKYDRQCQYFNNPIAPGDAEVSSSNVHRYKVDPVTAEIVCSCGVRFRASTLRRFMHFDPFNAKGVRSMSAPAIAVVGTSEDKHIFLLDYYVAKGDYDKVFDQLVKFNDEWLPEVFTFEDVGHQNMVKFHLEERQKTEEFRSKKHRKFQRIVPSPTRGKSKEVRVREGLLPYIEAGNFACRESQHAFLAMLDTWPHPVPGHDYDLLDALSQGPAVWQYPLNEDEALRLSAEEEQEIEEIGKPYSHRDYAGSRSY